MTSLPQNGYGVFQLLTIALVYGYILCYASNMISDGSELLLCVPAYAGIVGSIVLPVLGAVPDGCIVLFSGLGPQAQSTLNVGVGALAGSTIMLLTVPWFLSVMGGRVNVSNGEAKYKTPKLTPPNNFDLTETGVTIASETRTGSRIMLISALPFLILQVPAMFCENMSVAKQAVAESGWSLLGFICCCLIFICYLVFQYREANGVQTEDVKNEAVLDAIESNKITLIAIIHAELVNSGVRFPDDAWLDAHPHSHHNHAPPLLPETELTPLKRDISKTTSSSGYSDVPSPIPQSVLIKLGLLLKSFFAKYDVDNSKLLDTVELQAVLRDLGEKDLSQARYIQRQFEASPQFKRDGGLNFHEFVRLTAEYVYYHGGCVVRMRAASQASNDIEDASKGLNREVSTQDEDDEDEAEEVPPDLSDLSPDEQQRRIKMRAAWMLGVGTAIVLLFSDPMVNCLNEIGTRTNIPVFYVSFVLGPVASNISEVIASYNYSQKKTQKSMRIAMSTLQGAAVMNNSFVLGIFMLLVYMQGLSWEFFSETLVVLLVQIGIAIMTLKKTHTLFDGFVILSFYPLSLLLVAYLNSIGFN